MRRDTVTITVRVPAQVRDRLIAEADRQDMTISQLVRRVLRKRQAAKRHRDRAARVKTDNK